MTPEDVLYRAVGCPMTRFIKQRTGRPYLDGTAQQNREEMAVFDDIQRRAAKLYAQATAEGLCAGDSRKNASRSGTSGCIRHRSLTNGTHECRPQKMSCEKSENR